jgi:hypothetical protein
VLKIVVQLTRFAKLRSSRSLIRRLLCGTLYSPSFSVRQVSSVRDTTHRAGIKSYHQVDRSQVGFLVVLLLDNTRRPQTKGIPAELLPTGKEKGEILEMSRELETLITDSFSVSVIQLLHWRI